jgi:excisionase family DNA binding protein
LPNFYQKDSVTDFLLIPHFSHTLPYNLMVGKTISGESMADEIMTLKEVADYLKLAEKTAYRLAAEGKLPGFKVGGSWRFKREDILNWIEEQKKQG